MITHNELLALFTYDPETGSFTRNTKPGKRWRIGQVAGFKNSNGYIRLMINDSRFYAHRLAWFYVTKSWPPDEIDHINGDRSDNRFSNLRPATRAQNSANMKARPETLKGTSYVSKRKKWVAQIRANRRNTFLGFFDTKEEAHQAYAKAAKDAFGEFARLA